MYTGNIFNPLSFAELIEPRDVNRFYKHVCINLYTGCYEFLGAKNENKYGRFRLKHLVVYAHRFAYVAIYGDTQKVINHICFNRLCVNLEHLEALEVHENAGIKES